MGSRKEPSNNFTGLYFQKSVLSTESYTIEEEVSERIWDIRNFSPLISRPKNYTKSSSHINEIGTYDFSTGKRCSAIVLEAALQLMNKSDLYFTICLSPIDSNHSCSTTVNITSLQILNQQGFTIHDVDCRTLPHPPIRPKKEWCNTGKVTLKGLSGIISGFNLFLFGMGDTLRYVDGPERRLRIKFELHSRITTPRFDTEATRASLDSRICAAQALDDFKMLLNDTSTADVEIKATTGNTKFFHCHKLILSARSPVFRVMFESPMKEARQNVVEVEDISGEAMQHFLHSLYCGSFQNSSSIKYLPELVYASDKYCVQSLKDFCDFNLIEIVTLRNAFTVNRLAELHGLPKALDDIRQFINRNLDFINLDKSKGKDPCTQQKV